MWFLKRVNNQKQSFEELLKTGYPANGRTYKTETCAMKIVNIMQMLSAMKKVRSVETSGILMARLRPF